MIRCKYGKAVNLIFATERPVRALFFHLRILLFRTSRKI
ncbi:hypothetical protein X965_12185 [Morganella sp. EGD-HP17]|nr:hypothetical protein X965_12185 [Morganella sp. EGD-HP17]